MLLDKEIHDKSLRYLEILIILGASLFPLLINLPYRVNIFLTWEGAYRMYLGQLPFKDFGMPLGYGFFVLPYLFFKIFGPYLYTLVITQAVINIATLFAFSNLLRRLGLSQPLRLLSVFVFILSHTFQNFWPWYNQSVFVFQLIGFNFLVIGIQTASLKRSIINVIISSFFIFWAFFTKQDSGAIAIVFGGLLLAYHSWISKKYTLVAVYIGSLLLIGSVVIVPLLSYNFGYWFNLGQAPHNSRLKLIDFLNKIIGGSNWEKFYIGVILLIFIKKAERFKEYINQEKDVLFFLIAIGVVLQSLVIKITSPLPTDHHSYFHAFAFAYGISFTVSVVDWHKFRFILPGLFLVFLWWSALYWDYFSRIFAVPPSKPQEAVAEVAPLSPWNVSPYRAFRKIKMPQSTIDGIAYIKELDIVKTKKDLKVLNMSEITPLAHELNYTPMTDQPLWYHLDIGMFMQQVNDFCQKMDRKEYDLILYQDIPVLPTFYPQELKPCLNKSYKLIKKFEAPRKRTEGDSYIFVYIRQ